MVLQRMSQIFWITGLIDEVINSNLHQYVGGSVNWNVIPKRWNYLHIYICSTENDCAQYVGKRFLLIYCQSIILVFKKFINFSNLPNYWQENR